MALDAPHADSPGSDTVTFRGSSDAAQLVGDERLPCGRLISQVWERARDGPGRADAHAAACSYCRQAAEGLAALDAAIRGLRAEGPGGQTVADRVMRAVRTEVRLGRVLPLDDPARELRIIETAAARVLRRAADGIPGVRAASCRLTPGDDGIEVTIAMTLAVTLDEPLPDRATRVRRAVSYAARQQLGLAARDIDLRIVSVLEPFRPPAPAVPALQHGGER